jgi:hypothetical protein
MTKKPNLGDLILDYSEKDIENIGYIYDIHTDKSYSKSVPYRTMYGIFWLNPEPAPGDYYTLTEINKWIADGTWKYMPVKKNERKSKKQV